MTEAVEAAPFVVGAFRPKERRGGSGSSMRASLGESSSPASPVPSSSSPAFVFDSTPLRELHNPNVSSPPSSSSSLPSSLPPAAWQSLSSVLSIRDLARLVQVCRAWKTSVGSYVRVATLSSADGVRIKQLRALAPHVERLVFRDAAALMSSGESDLPSLACLKELVVVSAPDRFPSRPAGSLDNGMVEFCLISPHLPVTLTSLSIPMARFTRGSLKPLERLTRLTHLDLSRGDWRADDWNWTPLSDNPSIDDWIDSLPLSVTSLNLAHCHVLSDRLIRKLKRLPKLAVLNVENCFQLTDAGISSLSDRIEDLDLAQCIGVFRKGDTRSGMLPPFLTRLRLSFNFNDHFITHVVQVAGTLRALLLEKSHVTDLGMTVILSQCKVLEELSCAACINIGDETLKQLPGTIKRLDLWYNRNVTDMGLVNMTTDVLEVLDVTECPKVSLNGLVDAVSSKSSYRVVCVGTLFVPEHTLPRVAIVRTSNGMYPVRPRLFKDVALSVATAAGLAGVQVVSK